MRQISFNDFRPWLLLYFLRKKIFLLLQIPCSNRNKEGKFHVKSKWDDEKSRRIRKRRRRKNKKWKKCGWLNWIEANFLHDIINSVLYTLLTLQQNALSLFLYASLLNQNQRQYARHFITNICSKGDFLAFHNSFNNSIDTQQQQ